MKIAIAQINSTIGDFSGNRKIILDFTKKALDEYGADMILFPELAICGYPPLDLLEQDRFVELNIKSVNLLKEELPPGIAVGLGFVNRDSGALLNEYAVLLDGRIILEQAKTALLAGEVFDEGRWFKPAGEWPILEYKGRRIGFAIGNDVWRETENNEAPLPVLLKQNISLLCVPSAMPYIASRLNNRQTIAQKICLKENMPLLCINAVGANDQILFDGHSFVISPAQGGKAQAITAKPFEEDLICWDTATSNAVSSHAVNSQPCNELDILEKGLITGIKDYMRKCGFKRAHLGLSGGLDSALVAWLCVQAAGKENIVCISMPSRFSSQGSKDDAKELAENLGCRYEVIPIEPVFESALSALEAVFEKRPFDLAEENLQSRIRGIILMAFSNKFNSMLLSTGNKSELAMGYCTLYGDTNGALDPIGDLFKTEVYALCNRINERALEAGEKAPIPQAIIDKPPSAELRPNQKDQDSLPPYEVLDKILELWLHCCLTKEEIIQQGWDAELVTKIIRTVSISEFKRRQTPPVLKISPRTFGMGNRVPIARAIFEV